MRIALTLLIVSALLTASLPAAASDVQTDGSHHHGAIPDLTDAPVPLSARKGNLVAVPIPFSNPTLGSGLVAAAAYFYPQTATQKQTQPPSATGIAAMYSSNGSWAAAIAQASYWNRDRWRLVGAAGYADLDLPLLSPLDPSGSTKLDWLLNGAVVHAELSRLIASEWYASLSGTYLDMDQDFSNDGSSGGLDALAGTSRSVSLGPAVFFDSRDLPTNPYRGRYFKASAVFARPSFGSDQSYNAYSLELSGYHELRESLVLAWELAGCARSAGVPLWDACRIGLRGFPETDYMGRATVFGQAEARWRFGGRWGAVLFAGAGEMTKTYSGQTNHDLIPSYGIGLRFMVQPAERINMRLDYARSSGSDAVYLSVGEAF